MKIFAYALRPYDELGYLDALSRELGFDYDWTPDYPTPENARLAAGADMLSIITNPMTPELLGTYRDLGVRGIATRSIGYDHIDLDAARSLGIRVAHAAYPPEGVANYAIMLMMMALRKVKLVLTQAAVQDFSLAGKLGRDISSCTVGVVGTGRIGPPWCATCRASAAACWPSTPARATTSPGSPPTSRSTSFSPALTSSRSTRRVCPRTTT